MSNSPEADPIPDEPPAHLKGDKVVVTSPLSITEACFCIPAVRALRNARPDATIAVLTPDSIAPLWQTVGGLNEIIEYPEEASAKAIFQILKAGTFEAESSLWRFGFGISLALRRLHGVSDLAQLAVEELLQFRNHHLIPLRLVIHQGTQARRESFRSPLQRIGCNLFKD